MHNAAVCLGSTFADIAFRLQYSDPQLSLRQFPGDGASTDSGADDDYIIILNNLALPFLYLHLYSNVHLYLLNIRFLFLNVHFLIIENVSLIFILPYPTGKHD